MQNIPVIIYHEGNQEYLKVCIEHTKRYNKRVILIGDESNRGLCDEWYSASDLEKGSRWKEFLCYFENFSFYDDTFAQQIFKRLFLIENLIKQENIERFALLDSDVLIYINFSEVAYVQEYDMGCCTIKQGYEQYRWVTNIGISFFSIEALSDFIDFCIKEYKDNKEELLKKWEWHKKTKTPGGVGEMPLAYLWGRCTNKKIINLANTTGEYGLYENALNTDVVYGDVKYKMNNFLRIKKIKYIQHHPYYIREDGKLDKVDGLHFSTVTKKYMKSYSLYERATIKDYLIEMKEKIARRLKWGKK